MTTSTSDDTEYSHHAKYLQFLARTMRLFPFDFHNSRQRGIAILEKSRPEANCSQTRAPRLPHDDCMQGGGRAGHRRPCRSRSSTRLLILWNVRVLFWIRFALSGAFHLCHWWTNDSISNIVVAHDLDFAPKSSASVSCFLPDL